MVTLDEIAKYMEDGNFEVPAVEPADIYNHRTKVPGAKAPSNGAPGSVYCRFEAENPSALELAEAVTAICKGSHPEVLDSKFEKMFRQKGWKIIWTPPYCPKFQPIELVWGVGKQRAGTLFCRGRELKTIREHLRRGFNGGKESGTKRLEPCNLRGCWETALSEMAHWIAADVDHNPGGGAPKGVSGTLGNLLGADGWTQSDVTYLIIPDMAFGDDADIGEALGAQAVVIAQGDIEVAAAHLGGADS